LGIEAWAEVPAFNFWGVLKMPLILLWIVLPIIVIWGIYKIIRLFVLTGESVYEAKKENKEFASYLAKEEQKEE
jgi:Sec-independent protein translocase protein TatA